MPPVIGYASYVLVLSATFNNLSVLLVAETRVPGENHRPSVSH